MLDFLSKGVANFYIGVYKSFQKMKFGLEGIQNPTKTVLSA